MTLSPYLGKPPSSYHADGQAQFVRDLCTAKASRQSRGRLVLICRAMPDRAEAIEILGSEQ